jgi:AraC-like DNA-binding protein
MVWRARDVPRSERLYYMRNASAEAMVPVTHWYEDKEQDFPGWIRAADVGILRVVHASAPRGEYVLTPQLIRRASSEPARCGLFLQFKDRAVIEQDEQQVDLRPGDFTFADLSRPYRHVGSPAEFALVSFPRALSPLDSDDIRRLRGVAFSGRSAAGALVSALVQRLVADLDAYEGGAGGRVSSALLDLSTAALAIRLGSADQLPHETRQRALLSRIHAFIEERLGDPELTPSAIAAANHISLRYLHKLFESEGKTVAGWVRGRRLERCRSDLSDPSLRQRSVNAIAARWGFTNPRSFNRIFRAAYDIPPGEYRRQYTSTGRARG